MSQISDKKFWGYCPHELPLCSGSKLFPEPLMPQKNLSAMLLTKKTVFLTLTAKDFLLRSPSTQRPTLFLPSTSLIWSRRHFLVFFPELGDSEILWYFESLPDVCLFFHPWTKQKACPSIHQGILLVHTSSSQVQTFSSYTTWHVWKCGIRN